jgi:tetratricopeptide (TPR) repeat protein
MRRGIVVLACVLGACAGEGYSPERRALGPDTTEYPEGCAGLEESVAYRCAEQRFWMAFREHRDRLPTYDAMRDVLDRFEGRVEDREGRALLLFRRGQLANALVTEDRQPITYLQEAADDFRASLALHENPKVWPWLESIELPLALFANEPARAQAIFDQAEEHVELLPNANILSLSGVAMNMPLDTGMPERMLAMLERWDCDGYEWCERNTWRAPWGQPGLAFLFAEAYARMGRRAETVAYLERAQRAEGYAEWPYRQVVESAAADPDAWIGTFTAVPPHLPTFDASYLSAEHSCLLCHAAP